MRDNSSRRQFLASGLAIPVAGAVDTPKGIQYRTLGRTGLKVTTVGFGCMVTSDPSVIQRAADLGINFFDTARVYQQGNNERMVGAALKDRRKKVYLCTKSKGKTRQEALAHLDTSLQTLGTDYVDVWYLHEKRSPADLTDDLLDAQRIAKKQGKIRFAGMSAHSNYRDVILAGARSGHFDVLLVTYNFSMDKSVEELILAARDANVGFVAMKVMAGAFRLDSSFDRAREIVKRPGAMLAALKWALRNPNVHTTIPSMADMDQLDENITAMSVPFGDADGKTLAMQLERIRPLYCRMCGTCEGKCPQGLPVANVLRYLAYADGYGQFALGREHFLALPDEVRQVRCGDCASCAIRCPNGVRVAERLSRAQELFA